MKANCVKAKHPSCYVGSLSLSDNVTVSHRRKSSWSKNFSNKIKSYKPIASVIDPDLEVGVDIYSPL